MLLKRLNLLEPTAEQVKNACQKLILNIIWQTVLLSSLKKSFMLSPSVNNIICNIVYCAYSELRGTTSFT